MTQTNPPRPAAILTAPRRSALQAMAAGGLGLMALSGAVQQEAAAKKRRKRRRRRCRKRKKQKQGEVTCADVCPEGGGFTFHLFDGGDVCATGANVDGCIECATGAECFAADPLRFFCVKDFTSLTTGATFDFSGLCGPYTRGMCAVFEPCVLAS